MLLIPADCYNELMADAVEKYPSECCGFLLGNESNEEKLVCKIIICENKAAATKKEFLISPKNYMQAEKMAEENGLLLLGVYHSHPDSAALPSTTDLQNALPFFSYLIISVCKNKISSSGSWQLNEEHLFEEEKLIVNHNNLSNNNLAYGNHYHSHTAS